MRCILMINNVTFKAIQFMLDDNVINSCPISLGVNTLRNTINKYIKSMRCILIINNVTFKVIQFMLEDNVIKSCEKTTSRLKVI